MNISLSLSLSFLEINDKDLFKGLRVCKLETQQGSAHSFPKRKEKLTVFISEKYIPEKNQSCSVSLVPNGHLLDDWWSGYMNVLP